MNTVAKANCIGSSLLSTLLLLFFSLSASSNNETLPVYNAIGPDGLKNYAEIIGFEDCPDLDHISETLAHSSAILEIGGGYGRIIQGILKRTKPSSLIVLEPSEKNYIHLVDTFGSQANVHVHQKGILAFDAPAASIDLALWMWSGYADLNFTEQLQALQKIYILLKPAGTLVIDLPWIENDAAAQGHTWQMVIPSGLLYTGYIPSESKLSSDAKASGFKSIKTTKYSTTKQSERVVYLLKK